MAKFGPKQYMAEMQKYTEFALDGGDMEWLMEAWDLTIVVYHQVSIPSGLAIREKIVLGEGKYKIALLEGGIQNAQRECCWMISIGGKVKSDLIMCNTCTYWLPSTGFTKHTNECVKCHCGKIYKRNDDHEQLCRKPAGFLHAKKQIKGVVKTYQASKASSIFISHQHFADFEAFVPHNKYVVYAAGITSGRNNATNIFYGMDTMIQFLAHLNFLKGTLWFFNGGKFDDFFLFESCIRFGYTIKVDSLMKKGNQILSFVIVTLVGELHVKDLYRFLPGTLAANCKAFGVDPKLWKKEFDHNKMKTWEDVKTHQVECTNYLKFDVIALREVYINFATIVFELHKIHVCDFVTGSHMNLAAWIILMIASVALFIKTKKCDEANIRKAYRGGRIILTRKQWKSKHFDTVLKSVVHSTEIYEKGKFDYDKEEFEYKKRTIWSTDRVTYDHVDDSMVYIDYNSLYPSAQVRVKYPVGESVFHEYLTRKKEVWLRKQLQEQEKKHEDDVFKRIYCVDVTCPTDLMIPFLMHRTEEGETEQDLLPKVATWYVEAIEYVD